jgi:hypothetical protein
LLMSAPFKQSNLSAFMLLFSMARLRGVLPSGTKQRKIEAYL